MNAPAHFFPVQVRRRQERPPPLRVWLVVLALVIAIVGLASAYAQFRTPFPAERDVAFFDAQMRSLAQQQRTYRGQGQKPISIIFIGTSRMKNVALDWRRVAASAKAAGVQRPVASTYLAVNWGGFERFSPAIDRIERAHPDIVVIMPEFFFEDLSAFTRELLGFTYLKSKMWQQPFKFFSKAEFYQPVCTDEDSPAARLSLNGEWMTRGTNLPGPRLARSSVERLSKAGISVIIADVPVSASLAKVRPRFAREDFFVAAHLQPLPNVNSVWIGHPFAKDDYCDWAHIDPSRAEVWERAFFSRIAPRLNSH
jgi:hypothetical protein